MWYLYRGSEQRRIMTYRNLLVSWSRLPLPSWCFSDVGRRWNCRGIYRADSSSQCHSHSVRVGVTTVTALADKKLALFNQQTEHVSLAHWHTGVSVGHLGHLPPRFSYQVKWQHLAHLFQVEGKLCELLAVATSMEIVNADKMYFGVLLASYFMVKFSR